MSPLTLWKTQTLKLSLWCCWIPKPSSSENITIIEVEGLWRRGDSFKKTFCCMNANNFSKLKFRWTSGMIDLCSFDIEALDNSSHDFRSYDPMKNYRHTLVGFFGLVCTVYAHTEVLDSVGPRWLRSSCFEPSKTLWIHQNFIFYPYADGSDTHLTKQKLCKNDFQCVLLSFEININNAGE